MKAGQYTQPMKTQQGWHIFKVNKTIEAVEAELDRELKEKIEIVLLNQKVNELYPEWIKEVSKNG